MVLALISSFVFSPSVGDKLRGQVIGIFKPVSYPASRISLWAYGKFHKDEVIDYGSPHNPRGAEQVLLENQKLMIQLASMKAQLDRMIERENDRERLGDVAKLCVTYGISGTDSGFRDSLILSGTSFSGLRDKMAVIYPGGLVGRLSAVGIGGARITLITDVSSKLVANFTRPVRNDDGTIGFTQPRIEPKLVEGRGNGVMTARVTQKEMTDAGLIKDDWVVLNDSDWPRMLKSYRVGYIEKIAPTHDPGFFEVTIRPDQDLKLLSEVNVLSKENE